MKRSTTYGVMALVIVCLSMSSRALADDVGDSSTNCNSGEICLFDFRGSTNWTAQFWWSENIYLWDSGATRYFWDVAGAEYGDVHVYDKVSMVRNRDSSCAVGFYVLTNWQWDGTHPYTLIPNNSAYYDIPSNMDPDYGGSDGISSHKRCP